MTSTELAEFKEWLKAERDKERARMQTSDGEADAAFYEGMADAYTLVLRKLDSGGGGGS